MFFSEEIKIIFVDIDGTFRNNNRQITKDSINAVKELQDTNILVVLTSGRSRKYVEKIAKEAGTSEFIISSNGAEIYNFKENTVIYSETIDKISMKQVCELANAKNVHYAITSEDKKYMNYTQKNLEIDEILIEDIEEQINNIKPVQIVVSDTKFDKIKEMRNEIEKIREIYPANMHKSLINEKFSKEGTIYYDLVKKGVNKGKAIEYFLKYIGVSINKVAAIGDSDNDLDMIKIAGLGIAMGNATEKLKQNADWVTLDNEEDGFSFAVKKILEHNRNYKK